MLTTPSDDALMLAFARGDAAAFEQVYARHEQALYRFCRRLLGSSTANQVDEVFQDVWLRVVAHRERWIEREQGAAQQVAHSANGAQTSETSAAQFRTWLFTLAHNRAMDCLRVHSREWPLDEALQDESRQDEPQPEGTPQSDSRATNTEDLVFWRRAGQRLLQCLDGLPAAQRAAFLLHHEDGLSLNEMATALEVGFETAKTRLRYAMSKLRGCMGSFLPGQALQQQEGS